MPVSPFDSQSLQPLQPNIGNHRHDGNHNDYNNNNFDYPFDNTRTQITTYPPFDGSTRRSTFPTRPRQFNTFPQASNFFFQIYLKLCNTNVFHFFFQGPFNNSNPTQSTNSNYNQFSNNQYNPSTNFGNNHQDQSRYNSNNNNTAYRPFPSKCYTDLKKSFHFEEMYLRTNFRFSNNWFGNLFEI